MKEATVIYTVEFTDVVKDHRNLEFIANNRAEDLGRLLEQNMQSNTNYDRIEVKDCKVFLHEEEASE